MSAHAVTIDAVGFAYPGATLGTVSDVSVTTRPGEIVTLVGPSGCGKSTLLRLVAGLLKPSAGRIKIGAEDITQLPTHLRGIGWVPQSYALFEHLDVLGNVRFGPRMRGMNSTEQSRVASEMLKLCRIGELAQRNVADISGGQRQRVAIARALAAQPRVLLLDEPLAALDPQLREQLRSDLETLLRKAGLTTLFVTHDQTEALTLADRVVVMRGGKIEQFDTPQAIWSTPNSAFVATFFGADVISARVVTDDVCEIAPGLRVAYLRGPEMPANTTARAYRDDVVLVATRATDWIELDGDATTGALAQIESCEYSGDGYRIRVSFMNAPNSKISLRCEARRATGTSIRVALRHDALRVIPVQTNT
jgi:ABC-type Fe3+/spermidine/putrescine transport system ATPase subunit